MSAVEPDDEPDDEPARVVVVGDPEQPMARTPAAPHELTYVDAVEAGGGFSPRDVVVLRWDPAAAVSETIEALTRLPPTERPRVVVAGDVAEAAIKALIDRHSVVHVVGTRGARAGLDLAVTVDKLLTNDLFGLGRYFDGEAGVARCTCTEARHRGAVFDWVRAYAEEHRINRRIIDGLLVVADEMITNALFNAPTDASGGHPSAALPRTADPARGPAIEVELRCDGQRLGIATIDRYGSLEPEVVLTSLRRCFERAEPRQGPGGAGLGLYLLLGSVSHVVFNVARGRRTEVIGLMDVSKGYRQLIEAGKSFNLFVER
ncbi:MAG TPA: hypothetical protein VM734_34065 [Kofleriaceae bacterium]|jgi:hypothetical protein|nr:hypothetical protein [Kofleriaceae bacterium]